MACGLADTVATAFGAGGETLKRSALFDVNGFHLQLVDIGTIIVFSIGNSGLENLLDDARSFFLRESQNIQSLIHFFCRESNRRPSGLYRPTNGRPGGLHVFPWSFLISSGLFYPLDDP